MTLPKSYNGSYAPANHSGSDTVDDAFIEDILSLQHNVISAVQNLWGINERTKHALARRTAEETSLRERASRKIRDDYDKSRPYQQFQSQVTREERRLRDGTKDSKLRFDLKHIQELRTQAEQLVVSKWKEQGIWIDSWNSVPDEDAKWKHEVSAKITKTQGRDFEKEASRPYYQFTYQTHKEREYLSKSAKKPNSSREIPFSELSIKAYESVKRSWISEGIWRRQWNSMPGNKWLHEDDLEELIEDAVAEEKCRGEKKVTEKGTKKEDGFVWGGGF